MPTALLERDEQLASLRTLLGDATAGHGTMVFVGGEAGIGKSAVVERLCEDVGADVRVLVGGCDAIRTPRPLGPLFDMAHALGPQISGLLDGAGARERVFGHLLEALRERPTVVAVEDVHWADEATLDLLRYLGRRIAGTRALVIVTYRLDEVGASHPLRNVMGDLATAAPVTRMRLPPLTRDAVVRLAAGIDVDVDELHQLTAGNPFFVTEVVAAGGDRLPASVRDAIGARLSRLPEGARAAVEAASVVGHAVQPPLLRALGASSEAIDASIAGGLLQEAAGRLTFRHELARDAVLATLPAGRRQALHGDVLTALEAAPEAGADLATLAHHAAEAGDAEAVLRLAPAAGHRAAAFGAHREAWSQYARALPYLDRLPDEQHTELLEAYARTCEILGRLGEARVAWTNAIERWRTAGRTERWADDLTDLARVCLSLGDNAAAEAASAQAIEVLEGLPAGQALARAYRYQAALRMLDRDTDAAIAWGRRALDLASAVGDASVLAGTHGTVAASILLQGGAGYAAHFERSIELAREHGLHALHANAHVNRGSGAGELYRFAEAERYLSLALEVAERHDLESQASYALAWLALTQLFLGRWDEAQRSIEATLGRPTASAIARIMALVALGRLRVRRGDPEAWPPLDEALDMARRTDTLQRLAPVRAARAEAAWYEGDRERAGREAAASFELAMRARHPWFVGELGYWRRLSGGLEALPDWAGEPFVLEARGQSAAAADAWSALGCPFESARALGESANQREVRAAVAAFDRLGARVAGQRARARLHELGAERVPRGPREPTRRHPAGLTPREAQVLARLADGLSNAEIAARHGVSPRTVEHQVGAVLAKLGVATRTAAVAAARQRDLVPPT